MGDAHPVERAVLDALGRVHVRVVVDVHEADVGRFTGGTGDGAELDRAVAAQHEQRGALRQARGHFVGDRAGHAGRGVGVHGAHVLRVDPPAEAGHVAPVGDRDAALLEESEAVRRLDRPVAPAPGRGVRAGAARSADDLKPTRHFVPQRGAPRARGIPLEDPCIYLGRWLHNREPTSGLGTMRQPAHAGPTRR